MNNSGSEQYSAAASAASQETAFENVTKAISYSQKQALLPMEITLNLTSEHIHTTGPISISTALNGNTAAVICFITVTLSLLTTGGNLLVIAAFRYSDLSQTYTVYQKN